MLNIAVWLFAIIVPLVKKVLVALGIGVVTYGALTVLFSQVQSAVISAYGAMGSTTLQILALGGVTQAIGIILSAMSVRVAMIAIGHFGRVGS